MIISRSLSVATNAIIFFLSFFFFSFLGTHVALWRFPGESSNWSYNCRPTPQPQPQPRQIRAASVTYTTAHGNAGSLTHWVRPGFEPESSWILVALPLSHNRNSSTCHFKQHGDLIQVQVIGSSFLKELFWNIYHLYVWFCFKVKTAIALERKSRELTDVFLCEILYNDF